MLGESWSHFRQQERIRRRHAGLTLQRSPEVCGVQRAQGLLTDGLDLLLPLLALPRAPQVDNWRLH